MSKLTTAYSGFAIFTIMSSFFCRLLIVRPHEYASIVDIPFEIKCKLLATRKRIDMLTYSVCVVSKSS